jgi:hypothetical protein
MANIVKRLNYYDHQFLRAPDFSDEQNYHLSMRRLHNSALHTWGIAQGLQVTVASGGTGTAVTVSAGVALDSSGREMVLAANTNLELGGAAPNTLLYITISYDEEQSDPTTEAGGPGNTRVTEAPKLSFSKDAPDDPSMTLILAKVPRTSTGLGAVDASDRRQAGVVMGSDLTMNTLTLRRDGVAQPNWPVLNCSGANQVAFANAGLSLNGKLSIGPAVADRNLTVSVSDSSGVYANIKNTNHEVLVGVDSTAILSAMTASDLQIRTNNVARLTVQANTGKLLSPMWRATNVMNQVQGPLPRSANFTSGGGTLVIIFSGSGFAPTATNIGMMLQLDGSTVAPTRSFTNEPGSHKAFTTNVVVLPNIPGANHLINLIALPNTSTDGNDWFNVTVLELPF